MSIKNSLTAVVGGEQPRKRDPEKIRLWQEANREKVRGYQRKYRQTHKAQLAEYAREWRKKNPDKYKAALRRYAAKLEVESEGNGSDRG